MAWNKYEKTKHLKSVKPQIRIRKDGNCFISRAAYDQHFKGAEGVILFFDEENGRVGFQATSEDRDFVRKLRPVTSKNGNIYGARLSAKGFLEENGIEVSKVFDIEVEDFEGATLIVIDLNGGTEIIPVTRKKAEKETEECPPSQKEDL